MIRIALFALLLAHPAQAADLPARDMPRSPAEAHISRFGGHDRACLEWTNACQICMRDKADAAAQCSTAGIACTPVNVSCTRR